MAKSKNTRKFARVKPCQMGEQVTAICGDGPTRVARRKALAARLGCSAGYLQFLQVGEVDNLGKAMTPGDALAAKFRTVVTELGGIKKAGAALDGADIATTTAAAAPKAAKPQAKARKRAKATTRPKTAAKKSRKARKGAK